MVSRNTNPVGDGLEKITPSSSSDLSGSFSSFGKNYTGKYANAKGYQDAFNKYVNYLAGIHSDSDTSRNQIIKELDTVGDQFKSLYKNNVGREPTTDEISRFMEENGAATVQGGVRGSALRNQIVQYLGDTFQPQAEEVATQKAEDLSGKYSSLADQYMEMGKKSLGNLSEELKGYSTSLFEKLRPQLNLAAQAGGYADSGAQTLQEQGALTDLANQGQGVLGQAAYDVESNANNIRYGGMAAPVSMASEFAVNQPYALANAGAGALNFGNTNFMADRDFQRNLQMLGSQQQFAKDMQPSFGRSLSQSFANSFGKSLGQVGSEGAQGMFGALRSKLPNYGGYMGGSNYV